MIYKYGIDGGRFRMTKIDRKTSFRVSDISGLLRI